MLGIAERALLERLEDEALLEQLFRRRLKKPLLPAEGRVALAAEGLADPEDGLTLPKRAAGMIASLRRTDAGRDAIESARVGDLGPVEALLDAPLDGSWAPELLHHLALFMGRVAGALASEGAPPQRRLLAETRSLDAWAVLLSEGTYLRAIAADLAEKSFKPRELDELVTDAALSRLHAIGREARAGAHDMSLEGGLALGLLHHVERHAFPSVCEEALVETLRSTARRHAQRAVDAATETLMQRFDHAESDPAGLSEECAVLEDCARLFQWSRKDWHVALFAMERATPVSWALYKDKQWATLGKLCETLRPCVEAIAARVQVDPVAMPYAAPVAQMLVFRAEMGADLKGRIADAERALALCDTHRNARVILADLLAERAVETLDSTGMLGRDAALSSARTDAQRADELWPGLPRVKNVLNRIDRMSGVLR